MSPIEMMAMSPTGPFEPIFMSSTLTPNDPSGTKDFGRNIAGSSDGTTVVIAAPNDSAIASNAGSVYVFVRSAAGGWSQQVKLTSSTASQKLGSAVSMSSDGNTLVVGTNDSSNIYVYTRSGTTWSAPTTISPSVGATGWGSTLAVNGAGTRIAVGAPLTTYGGNANAGTIFVYDLISGVWTETLTALGRSGSAAQDRLGACVDISGDGNYIVAVPSMNGAATTIRGIVFFCSAGVWSQQATLTDYSASNLGFSTTNNGAAINADGSLIATGANQGTLVGASVFKRNGTNWALNANPAVPSSFQNLAVTSAYVLKACISDDGAIITFLMFTIMSGFGYYQCFIFQRIGNGAYGLVVKNSSPYQPTGPANQGYFTFMGGGYSGTTNISGIFLSGDGKTIVTGTGGATFANTAQSGDRV